MQLLYLSWIRRLLTVAHTDRYTPEFSSGREAVLHNMAITDNKTFGWNINLWQFLGLVAIAALVVLAIATNQLVWGYIAMTLVLCAFFGVVAFNIGIQKDKGARADAGERREDGGR